MSSRLLARWAALLLVGTLTAQISTTWVPFDDRTGPPDHPFGLNVAPDQTVYHVTVAGSFTSPNRLLAVVDRATRSVVARYRVGLFPEEVAYQTAGRLPPRIVRILVTNSSGGSVSVLDAQGGALATIALGANTYPYGIAVRSDGREAAVTTKSGRLFVLDLDRLRVRRTLNVAGFHSRVTYLPDGQVLFAAAVPAGGQQTRVVLYRVDPAGKKSTAALELVAPRSGYPSAEDLALVKDGREAWVPLLGVGATVVRVDLARWQVAGTLSLAAVFPSGLLHGIGASGQGHVLVTSLGNGENHVALLRVDPPALVTTVALATGLQPNDVVFTGDGREACVTMQWGAAGVHILKGLPVPPFTLTASTLTPPVGGTFTLELRGGASFADGVVGLSVTGPGPTPILGLQVALSLPIWPLWAGLLDERGLAAVGPVPVPGLPSLRGLRLYLQALTRERAVLRLSNPLVLVLR